jgi:hypothetical protein
MAYTLEQVKEILTDAAIRADWKNISFRRSKFEIEVIFGSCLMDGKTDGEFYKSYTCTMYGEKNSYTLWENGTFTEISEDEWFAQVKKYFWTICGTHLKVEENIA